MYIKISKIISYLSYHPYFAKLSPSDKINVLNIALSDYKEIIDAEIVPLFLRDNYILPDGSLYVQDKFSKLGNPFNTISRLSQFTLSNLNISETDYIKELDDEDKWLLYSLAVAKVSKFKPSYYKIEIHYKSIELVTNSSMPLTAVSYSLMQLPTEEYYSSISANPDYTFMPMESYSNFLMVTPDYSMTPQEEYISTMTVTPSYSYTEQVDYSSTLIAGAGYILTGTYNSLLERYNVMPLMTVSYSID